MTRREIQMKEAEELGIDYTEYLKWKNGFRNTYIVSKVITLEDGHAFTPGETIPVRTYC